MEKQEAKSLGHRLVLVVYPFQGHINPMLQLATILYTKGFSITIAHPQFNSPNHENHPEFHFVSIPDGLSKTNFSPSNFMAAISTLNSNCEAPFQQYMEEMMKVEDPHDRVASWPPVGAYGLSKTNFSPSNFMAAISTLNSNCEAPFQQYMEEMMKVEDPHDRVASVVYDGFMHFAQAVANNLKLPGINVHTSAAATLLLFAVFPDAHHEKGYISFPESLAQAPMPELQSLDLKGLLGSTKIPIPILELRAIVTDTTKKSLNNNSEHNALP
nr:UDP-glycosyltransferase 76B1-like [Quercus suber]